MGIEKTETKTAPIGTPTIADRTEKREARYDKLAAFDAAIQSKKGTVVRFTGSPLKPGAEVNITRMGAEQLDLLDLERFVTELYDEFHESGLAQKARVLRNAHQLGEMIIEFRGAATETIAKLPDNWRKDDAALIFRQLREAERKLGGFMQQLEKGDFVDAHKLLSEVHKMAGEARAAAQKMHAAWRREEDDATKDPQDDGGETAPA